MQLFTDNQSKVISKIWIPAVLGAIFIFGHILLKRFADYTPSMGLGARIFDNYRGALLTFLPLLYLTYNLEFFILENKHRFTVAIASFALLGGAWAYFENFSTDAMTTMKAEMVTVLIWAVLLLMRSFSFGKKDKNSLVLAIATAFIFGLKPLSESVFHMLTQGYTYQNGAILELVYCSVIFPVTYYLVLFIGDNLTDNSTRKDYLISLRSKLTVIDKRSYLFLFIGLYSLLLPAAERCVHIFSLGGMRQIQEFFSGNGLMLISFLYCLGVMITVPYVLRNILVARSMTINNTGKVWFLFHFFPVFHIIPAILYYAAPDVNVTAGENGTTYMSQPMPVLRYVMSGLGIAVLVYQMIVLDARMDNDVSIFYALAFIRIVLYILVFKKEFAAFLLPGISILIVFFSKDYGVAYGGLTVMLEVLAMQYFQEIYHPSLEDADAEIYLNEAATIGEDVVAIND
ncbi:hypothetical protein [Chitinophaga sp. Cy-1792]|uniref:hypothetical protein n=1 Tax=Chitinophaga sp. Cy-1792 TaxID=2608339 RepID=UPI00142426A9|nr:hypothetical protein [Chitinophaga sp. Cy-1792]NIG52736.1 hypothetical protein [Chitinophaga sp. Cy-1792]